MKNAQRGFTLIEVLLAILIGSIVLTSVYGIFSTVSNARNRLESEGEVYHQMRIFFDRVGGELRSLKLSAIKQQPVFRAGTTDTGEPYFAFSTELVSPLYKQRGGLSHVRYQLQTDGDDSATLNRSEQVLLVDLAPSEPLPFIEGVKSFQVRCYSQGTWQEQWSNVQPPSMVEISLELNVAGQVVPFRSAFVLPEAD